MKKKVFFTLLPVLVISGLLIFSCDTRDSDGLICSIQVNNKAAAKAIADGDEVELYIKAFSYIHETSPKWIIIVASAENSMTDMNGNQIINDGWFSVDTTEWINQSDHESGLYSAIGLEITKLKVNGKEYSITKENVLFGDTKRKDVEGPRNYIDKFPGATMTDNATGLRTILTVDPNIIGMPDAPGYDSSGLADDPYEYITIQGIIE
ncbi:MAG: hypothetical protein FWH35_07245 [Treponema sp.]|nr:hypothetical protein [Treponema sp.]